MTGPVMAGPATCPLPDRRAPRVGPVELARLHRPPASLTGALIAVIWRDTQGAGLDDVQRLSHFPASPLMSLSWFHGQDAGLVDVVDGRAQWRPFGSAVVIAGSQSLPTTGWAPTPGRGGMLLFTVDIAQVLFGVDPALVHERFVDARALLAPDWHGWLERLAGCADAAAALAVVEAGLAPRWQSPDRGGSVSASLSRLGSRWVERLAWQARQWQQAHGQRQVERRIKRWTGRSLRQWQALVRTEGLFFTARERHAAGAPFDWAALALDEGFADQSPMTRASRRISGFAPGEFAKRFVEDESFWLYRLWI